MNNDYLISTFGLMAIMLFGLFVILALVCVILDKKESPSTLATKRIAVSMAIFSILLSATWKLGADADTVLLAGSTVLMIAAWRTETLGKALERGLAAILFVISLTFVMSCVLNTIKSKEIMTVLVVVSVAFIIYGGIVARIQSNRQKLADCGDAE